jgi:capsular polysaccharide export protein
VSQLSCLGALEGRHVLLLQGPNGPFFARLAEVLEGQGARVTKVNFNGGDCVFYPRAEHVFRGVMNEWSRYCERLFDENDFDWVLLFGDCRPIHRAAIEIASRRGVRVGVFEEGYVRPNFVTFEEGGVNAYSSAPKEPWFFRAREAEAIPAMPDVEGAFWYSVLWSAVYHTAASVASAWFPRYRHHRKLGIAELVPWVRGAVRKYLYARRERGVQEELTEEWKAKFFLVPLQVHNDAQVKVHSEYRSVADFVRDVIASFARGAPADTRLVIKHHPLDRGYNDYARLVEEEARACGIEEGRVLYIHDQHLPSLLDATRGVVVINSTAGLQALDHRAPVKVCGRAVYDIEGLTFRGGLDAFWKAAEEFTIDAELFASFKSWLVKNTQLGGSFYRPLATGALLHDLGVARGVVEAPASSGIVVAPAPAPASEPIEIMSAAE